MPEYAWFAEVYWGVFLFYLRKSTLRSGKNGVSVSICGPRSHRTTTLVYLGIEIDEVCDNGLRVRILRNRLLS